MRQIRRWAVVAASMAPAVAAHAAAPAVSVAGGRLQGTMVADGRVRAFLGIPFAAPPVGPLRWREPQPVKSWKGARRADAFAARCMQLPLFSDMAFRSPGVSEDCLYLNVWAPAAGSARAKLPVLVYIYGGGFQAGDASEKRYDGTSMARRGIVTVTMNYRLGALGFLAHPALTAESPHHASGNYGLMDQAAALAWVRRNIAAFGGDPSRITLAGESAGSMSVSALMASPLTRGGFARAIGESGAMMPPAFREDSLAEHERAGAAFGETLGATTLAAMRALPADRLLEAQGKLQKGFGPIVDGYVLTETPRATFATGRQAMIPLLLGTNSQESAAAAVLGDQLATYAGYAAALTRRYGQAAPLFRALYPAATDAEVIPAATALASDLFLTHATWRWFDLHRRSGQPTYYYLYTRVRPPALTESGATPPWGATHSAEIEYALGNLDANPRYAWTAEDRQASATMQGYWVNFVKTGDPNGPGLPRWTAAPAGDLPIERQEIGIQTRAAPFRDQAREEAIAPMIDQGAPR